MGIKSVTCITDCAPHGQVISAAELEYEEQLAVDVDRNVFSVEFRNIVNASVRGNIVRLELNPNDKTASVIPQPEHMGPPPKSEGEEEPPKKPEGPPPGGFPAPVRERLSVTVGQLKSIKAADGSDIPASGAITSDKLVQPIIDNFIQAPFKDINYNLYIPKNLEEGKTYPLVTFLHDAGVCAKDPFVALSQGNGATSFADPAWQAGHPCFVLAPSIPDGMVLTRDDFTCESDVVEEVKALIDKIAAENPVDKNRIYVTGQSMGCMTFSELNVRYPEAFAASLLVAGQWNPETMAEACKKCKFWILVSQNDAKAFPGMNAVVAALEEKGVKFGHYHWDAKAGADVLDKAVKDAMAEDVDMRYTYFDGSSVVPYGEDPGPGANHVNTWPVVYDIPALKEWLFAQSK